MPAHSTHLQTYTLNHTNIKRSYKTKIGYKYLHKRRWIPQISHLAILLHGAAVWNFSFYTFLNKSISLYFSPLSFSRRPLSMWLARPLLSITLLSRASSHDWQLWHHQSAAAQQGHPLVLGSGWLLPLNLSSLSALISTCVCAHVRVCVCVCACVCVCVLVAVYSLVRE